MPKAVYKLQVSEDGSEFKDFDFAADAEWLAKQFVKAAMSYREEKGKEKVELKKATIVKYEYDNADPPYSKIYFKENIKNRSRIYPQLLRTVMPLLETRVYRWVTTDDPPRPTLSETIVHFNEKGDDISIKTPPRPVLQSLQLLPPELYDKHLNKMLEKSDTMRSNEGNETLSYYKAFSIGVDGIRVYKPKGSGVPLVALIDVSENPNRYDNFQGDCKGKDVGYPNVLCELQRGLSWIYYPDPKGMLHGKEFDFSTAARFGGHGGMRADRNVEVDYCWMGNKELGLYLKLSKDKYIEVEVKKKTVESYAEAFSAEIQRKAKEDYFLTNVPWQNFLPIDQVKLEWVQARSAKNTIRTRAEAFHGSEILFLKKFTKRQRKNYPMNIHELKKARLPLIPRFLKMEKDAGKGKDSLKRKKKKGKIENGKSQGELLQDPSLDREDAAIKMAQALLEGKKNQFRKLWGNSPAARLAALEFVLTVLQDEEVAKGWKVWTAHEEVLTEQEWCHLLGHGDSGKEELPNFVAGSKHCNTEQLAIETGLRAYRGKSKVPLRAKITAYTETSFPELPWLIRYKLLSKGKKIFEHLYDAQLKSFTYFEFEILRMTVQRCVAFQDKDLRKKYESTIGEDYVFNKEMTAAISLCMQRNSKEINKSRF